MVNPYTLNLSLFDVQWCVCVFKFHVTFNSTIFADVKFYLSLYIIYVQEVSQKKFDLLYQVIILLKCNLRHFIQFYLLLFLFRILIALYRLVKIFFIKHKLCVYAESYISEILLALEKIFFGHPVSIFLSFNSTISADLEFLNRFLNTFHRSI